MELVEVIDDAGNYTGLVVDREEVRKKKLRHWEVVVFVVNEGKQLLLQQRSAKKKYNPNKWAPVAGGVIAYESIEEAAIRELEEEIGVKFKKEELKVLDNVDFTRYFYVGCNLEKDEFKIQEEEVECVEWFDIDKVIEMIKRKDDSLVFKKERLKLLEKLKELI